MQKKILKIFYNNDNILKIYFNTLKHSRHNTTVRFNIHFSEFFEHRLFITYAFHSKKLLFPLEEGCTKHGRLVYRATTFCTMTPNICGSSIGNLIHIALLALRILRWLPDSSQICATLLILTVF